MRMRRTKQLILTIITIVVVSLGVGGAYFFYIIKDLPDVTAFDNRKIAQSSKIFDRTGKILLYEIHGEEKRTIIPFEEIPTRVQQATVAIEDTDFYNHSALDWRGVIRAAITNLRLGRAAQGGSTITQQLAKNAFLSTERTISRKLKELVLAFELEHRYTKDQILTLYLNQIPYGANSYGIAAAAQSYFGKNVADLQLAEIATLVSLPRAPSYYAPWGTHKEELLRRKDAVLEKMFTLGEISKEELRQAKLLQLVFAPQTTSILAPHFVMEVIDYLNKEYGEETVQIAGWNIITTLDYPLQQIAEVKVKDGAKRNEELYGGKNAALVAEDTTNGQILALVGSRDYFDTEIDGNFDVATQGLRQPGSALKPFVYLTAFEKGFTPDTILFDLETEFETSDDPEKSYKPGNFDEIFRGPMRMKEALAQSLNIPAVKTLYLAGIDNVLKTVHDFGISTLTERSRYGLSLVLGGGEVKLFDLVSAYAGLSQEGVRHAPSLILKIEESTTKKTLEEYRDNPTRAVDAEYARVITNILSDVELRKPLFHASLGLTTFPNQEVALKTGTTNDYRDAWALGYTPSLAVGVWAGNNDNTPMERKGTSILAAVPIWSAVMNELLRGKPLETFNQPNPITADKPALQGALVINNQVHDILYYVDKKNPKGPPPQNPEQDSQFKNWEDPVIEWLKTNPIETLSDRFKDMTSLVVGPRIQVREPQNGAFIKNTPVLDTDIITNHDLKTLEISLNNSPLDIAPALHLTKINNGYNYRADIPINKLDLQNAIHIRAIDTQDNAAEQTVIFFR